MDLREGVRLWLGEGRSQCARRAILVGAGFTKACEARSPLFSEYRGPALEALCAAALPPETRAYVEGLNANKADITELVEMLDRHAGRVRVAKLFLTEPTSTMLFSASGGRDPDDTVYRPLKEWGRRIGDWDSSGGAFRAGDLHPSSPHLLVARLVAEGVIDEVLTTNWDAYLELGVWLTGHRVEDAEYEPGNDAAVDRLPAGVRVIESADEMNLCWAPLPPAAPLYKLHGGVRSARRFIDRGEHGDPRSDDGLRRSFLAASSDLTRWRDSCRWVADRVASTLRSHSTMVIGVSGLDPVTFDAFRQHIKAWEDSAERAHRAGTRVDPPRLVAVDWAPTERLQNMLSVRLPGSVPTPHSVKSRGDRAMEGLYASWLLDLLVRHADEDLRLVAGALKGILDAELSSGADSDSPTPLVGLLALALGPGARWAGMFRGRPPFNAPRVGAKEIKGRAELEARWWYSPWRGADASSLRSVLAFLGKLAEDLGKVHVEPTIGGEKLWGGLRIDAGHPHFSPTSDAHVLLAPNPWGAGCNLEATAMISALQRALGSARFKHEEFHLRCLGWPDASFLELHVHLNHRAESPRIIARQEPYR